MVILSAILTTSILLCACASKAVDKVQKSENADPFGKYSTPISLTSCRIQTSWMTLPTGDDENNNVWSRVYLDKLGIKLTQAWTAPNWGEPLDSKINISITSDSLPDILPVYTTLFYRIAQGGKAADLTSVLAKYGSPELKKIVNANNGVGLKSASINGKLYGLPQIPDTTSRSLLFIRKDWLDKLGLQMPQTLDEVLNLAKTFHDKDAGGTGKTIGFEMAKDFFGSDNDPKFLFQAFHLYTDWVLQDGKLVRGETLPENKVALEKMAQMYKDGTIPKDFVLKDPTNDSSTDVISGKVGIIMNTQGWLAGPAAEGLHKKDPKAEWIAMPIPTVDGKPYLDYVSTRIANFWAVSAKCKNPEALIKMANLQVQIDKFDPKYVKDNTFNMSPTGNMNFWCKATDLTDPLVNINSNIAIKAAMESKDPSKLNYSENDYYTKATSTDPSKGDWGYAQTWATNGPNDLAFGKLAKNILLSPAWGPETPAWTQNGQDLYGKVREYFIKAITTGKVDQQFDEWINYWNTQGGKEATQEINDWYAKNK